MQTKSLKKIKAKKKTKIYISGQMTGMPDLNRVAFNEVEEKLTKKGYIVYNPVKYGDEKKDSREELMKKDFELILDSDKVVVLPNWENSWGAVLEVTFAREIGLPIEDVDGNPVAYIPPLVEAQKIINADRQWDYGHPIDDYSRTANMWGEIMGKEGLSAYQAVLGMIAVKISREVHKPKRDNRLDIAGYAGCLEKIALEEERRKNETVDSR